MFIRKYFTSLIFRKYWAQSGGSGCGQKPQMHIHEMENGVLVWREGIWVCEILTDERKYEWKYDGLRHYTNRIPEIWKFGLRKTKNEFESN